MNIPAQFVFATALGASVLFHGAIYSGAKLSSVVDAKPIMVVPQQKLPPKVSFEFVDSPDEAIDEAEAQKTNLISSKSTRARDLKKDVQEALKKAPSMPVDKESQQLSKKRQPNLMLEQRRGAKIPNNDFITPLDEKIPIEESLEIDEKVEETEKEKKEKKIEEMKKELNLLEAMQVKLQKKLANKKEDLLEAQRKKVQKKREQEMSQNLVPQGNAEQNRKVVVYDPSRNIDTYQAKAVQKFLATAIDIGSPSFSAQKHLLGPYLKEFKSRVAPLWLLKLESQSTGGLLKTKKVVLGVQILSDGTLGSLLILKDFGDDLFNKLCLDTFIELAPFKPLPKEWIEKSGQEYLNIIYRFRAY